MHQILCFGDSNSFGTMPVMGLGQAQSYPAGQRWPDVMAEEDCQTRRGDCAGPTGPHHAA